MEIMMFVIQSIVYLQWEKIEQSIVKVVKEIFGYLFLDIYFYILKLVFFLLFFIRQEYDD